MSKIELALPVANWVNKTEKERVDDFSSALLELERRPNIYWTTIDQLQKLKTGTRTDTPYFQAEHVALESEINWATNGQTRFAAWFSSELPGTYPCSRVILSKRFEENNQIRILNVAFCLPFSRTTTLKLANVLSCYSQRKEIYTDPERLRSKPVYFDLPPNKSLRDVVKILSGENLEDLFARKFVATNDASDILMPYHAKISSANTQFGQVLVGATLEQQATARGYVLNKFRDCPGILNTEALNQLGSFNKLFNVANNPDRYVYDEIAECKSCKELKKVASSKHGGCGVCRDCQIKFDSGELQ